MRASELLARLAVVDLTQELGPDTVLWPGSLPFAAATDGTFAADGCYHRTVRVPEHSGTHLDAPAHFTADGITVEAIAAERLVVEAAVIDIAAACAADPDHVLTAAEVEADEAAHGRVPDGAAVLVRTGWDRHRGDAARYLGPADALRFPGVGEEAARLLVEGRRIVGLGIDTLGIDAGAAPHQPVHTRVTLPAGCWHLEGLIGLERLPARGSLLVVGAPLLVGGSGVPSRVLALIAKEA